MSEINGERVRNMCIGESGRGLRCVQPLMAQNLGKAMLEGPEVLVNPPDEPIDIATEPANDAWAKGRSLDEMVGRPWDWWK